MTDNQHIQIYQSADGHVQLHVTSEQETFWLSQSQMGELFETSSDNVSLHLKNIYKDGELREAATTEDFSVVRQEGNRQVKRQLKRKVEHGSHKRGIECEQAMALLSQKLILLKDADL